MIRKILDWIVSLLLRLYNSPIAREMAMTTLKIAAGEFKDALAKTLEAVKEANDKNMTGTQKKNYVLKILKAEFGDIPKSMANYLIESALAMIKQED
jgi:hypothetical protein